MRVSFSPEETRPVYKMEHEEIVPTHFDLHDPYDYCRGRALELAREEIGNLPGNVAEVGVGFGHFARLINYCFPDRKLFLYDTFGGFDKRDVDFDLGKDFVKGAFRDGFLSQAARKTTRKEDFPDPAVIQEKCPHPERLVFRKGYFPETAAPDGEEKFSFVSLDTDLYQPIYAGLEFFYPRLHEGGVIFVHDYNNWAWTGVKHAVHDIEKVLGPFKKMPLPDAYGTLVIMK
jgi:O-methyltransferase